MDRGLELVKSQFECFKGEMKSMYSNSFYKSKFQGIHDSLDDILKQFNIDTLNSIRTSNFNKDYQLIEIDNWLKEIDEDIIRRKEHDGEIEKRLLKMLYHLKSEINKAKVELLTTLNTVNEKGIIVKRKPSVNDYSESLLSQKQVFLLMDYFRKERLVISDINDKTISEIFHHLTGYSAEKLRQGYSDYKKRNFNFSKLDKENLSMLLRKIGDRILSHE